MRRLILAPLLAGAFSAQAAPPASLEARVDVLDAQSYHFVARLEHADAVTLSCQEQGNQREHHRVSASAAEVHHLTVRGLKAATRYSCALETAHRAVDSLPPVSFLTAALPQGLVAPLISVPATSLPETGYTLYNYMNSIRFRSYSYLVILDAEGNVRWNYRLSDPGFGGGATGDMDATWMGEDRVGFGGDLSSRTPPTIVNLSKQILFTGTAHQMTPDDKSTTFSHDSGPSSDGLSFIHMNDTTIAGPGSTSPESPVNGFILKQLDLATNQILWYWDSIEHGYDTGGLDDPGAWYSSQSQFPGDPYHANSVEDRWEDGHLYVYVGLRHQNEIIKIDYESREVVWKLGVNRDFELLESDGSRAAGDFRWFFNQHDAHVMGNRVYMFDNGADRNQYGGSSYSRVLELVLDEDAMTARIAFEYTEPGWLEYVFGGYDILPNGHRLIARPHSSWGSTSGTVAALIELDEAGKVVWRADFNTGSQTMYRAERIDGCEIFNNVQYCPRLQ